LPWWLLFEQVFDNVLRQEQGNSLSPGEFLFGFVFLSA